MGALLSQAVANQLRQYPGFQNPNPSPPILLQQLLNPSGPSMPTVAAPVMENQQLLQTSMDPRITAAQRDAANRAFQHQMLMTAMAFGGADITKEQKAAWEAENEAYRASRRSQLGNPARPEGFEPGTRVNIRPYIYREDVGKPTRGGLGRTEEFTRKEKAVPETEGVVVVPGTPEAGMPAETGKYWIRREREGRPDPENEPQALVPPSPDHVAVRNAGSNYWWWRHRDSLEILPPVEEFPVGTRVIYSSTRGDRVYEGYVAEPPKGEPRQGPDYVWVDVYKGRPESYEGTRRYTGGWGGWFTRKTLYKWKK